LYTAEKKQQFFSLNQTTILGSEIVQTGWKLAISVYGFHVDTYCRI